jgi:hypothetical protein
MPYSACGNPAAILEFYYMAKKAKLIETAATLSQAPDEGSAAATTEESGDTEVVKRAVAKHELLDEGGAVVETEEVANGIRYTLLANSQTFEYQYGKNPAADKMLAIFGAKTLATNETSAARHNSKGANGPDEQIEAVRERFATLEGGKWVDRTRDGVGAKVDPDALAEAIIRVVEGEGKLPQGQTAETYKAVIRQKIEDDKAYARKARQMPKVATEYATLVGRSTATVDDLLA